MLIGPDTRVSCGSGQQHPFRAPQRVHRIAFEMVSSGVRTRWMHSRRHQLVADRVPHEIRPRGKLELTHDARTVRLDCFHADVEKVSALHVRVAFCDQLHDLPLAPSPRPIRTARRSRLAPARVGWHDVRGRHAGRFAWQARETTVRNTGPGGMSGRRGAKLASLDHFTPPLISGRPPFAISASR